jgi:dTDP-glucose pyrophosphorylase
MIILIPLCGKGERFVNKGYTILKPFINVFNKEIINHVIDSLNTCESDEIYLIINNRVENEIKNIKNKKIENKIFGLTSEKIFEAEIKPEIEKNKKIKNKNIKMINIEKETEGATETIVLGIERIITENNKNTPVLIADGDNFYGSDIIGAYNSQQLPVSNAVVCFEVSPEEPEIYSYVKLEDDNIKEIKEKKKISNYANTGAYFFRSLSELYVNGKEVISSGIKVRNESYISCIIDLMIRKSPEENIFRGIEISKEEYFCLGTPEHLENYIKNTCVYLFDLDGTLVETDGIYYKVWKEILQEYKIHITPEMYKTYIYSNNDAIKNLDRLLTKMTEADNFI